MAEALNERRIRSPRGSHWSAMSVRREVLRSEALKAAMPLTGGLRLTAQVGKLTKELSKFDLVAHRNTNTSTSDGCGHFISKLNRADFLALAGSLGSAISGRKTRNK